MEELRPGADTHLDRPQPTVAYCKGYHLHLLRMLKVDLHILHDRFAPSTFFFARDRRY
jgi:hypothetical protein